MLAFIETDAVTANVTNENQSYLQQYAILPWRRAKRLEILLITSRQSMRWIIPKGWPMTGHTAGETASQEAYEEAGVHGRRSEQCIGRYGYSKRVKGGDKRLFRVDVFGMEVTEALDSWPEANERERQWFTPAEAAIHVYAPELSMLIRTFSEEPLGQNCNLHSALVEFCKYSSRCFELNSMIQRRSKVLRIALDELVSAECSTPLNAH